MLKTSASAKRMTTPIWIASAIGALFLALGLGVFAGSKQQAMREGRNEAERMKTVSAGLRTVRDGFDRDVKSLKAAALGLPEAVEFSNGILLWAELDSSASGVSGIKRTLVNPDWKLAAGEQDRLQTFFLPTAVAYLNQPERWREIRKGKTELLRVRKDATGPDEWLALAFGMTQTAPALGANFAGSTLLVVVDPERAFSSVTTWGVRGEARGLRSFIAASDGRVLTHSLRRFTQMELGGSHFFRAALNAISETQNTRRPMAGSAIVKRIEAEEGKPVTLAASPAGLLPVYLVVEQTLEIPKAVVAATPTASKWNFRINLGMVVLFGLLLGFAIYLLQLLQRRQAFSRAQAHALAMELEARRAQETAYLLQVRAEEQAKVREEMRLAEEARQAEQARQNEILGRIRAAEQELVRRFEIEVMREEDPKRISYSVSQLAHQLCRAPALFFAYQPLTKKAFLTTAVGFPLSSHKPSFLFELSDEVLREIQEADLRGESLSLSDYLPLSSAMQLHFKVRQFRSWALTGETKRDWSGNTHARLLGVLVVLPSQETQEGQDLPVGSWIPGMLKTASRQYEKALPSS